MTILSRLRRKYSNKDIIEHTAEYFEMQYLKFEEKLFVCFMAPNQATAEIKSKSVLRTINGEKVLSIKKLDSKRLGQTLTWNRDGSAYSKYQSKRDNIKVYRKKQKGEA